MTRTELETVELEFTAATGSDERSLSGAAAHNDYLFVAPDEGASIVRLRREHPTSKYDDAAVYPVDELVHVPGAAGGEIDLEGMDIADGFLWLAGSHSAVRKRVGKHKPVNEIPRTLAEVAQPRSRRLLARLPLDGRHPPTPVRAAGRDGGTTSAASLPDDDKGLHALLQRDGHHLGPFLDLPGKDNGLDIEGMAVVGSRVLLGLRGPVLRGWAVIVEIEPRPSETNPGALELAPIGQHDPPRRFVKHFLDLDGLGIRDLARHGNDLLILAGPTMVLDGPSRVLRLRNGASDPLPEAIKTEDLEQVDDDLPVGAAEDHPEAITVEEGETGPRLLVIYDSPSKNRRTGNGVRADRRPLA